MLSIITPEDLEPFAEIDAPKAQAMIDDALADASRVAPCITSDDLTPEKVAQFKAVLRTAILRWNEAGSGALQQQVAGSFSITTDTRQAPRGRFWPSELDALREICRPDGAHGRAFEVDTMPADAGVYEGYPIEGLPHVSQVTGRVYYSSQLGYLDVD